MRNKLLSIFITVLLSTSLCSCSSNTATENSSSLASSSQSASSGSQSNSSSESAETTAALNDDMFTSRDVSGEYDESTATKIELGNSVTVNGSGASVSDSTITISQQGTYIFSGAFNDGNIIIDCADETAKVQLVLNNATIKCSSYAPIYAKSPDKLFITLADNTENVIEDSGEYQLGDDDANVDGAVFAKCTTTFNGTGALTVNGTQNHAVVSKDSLKVASGTLNITSVSDALQGKDSVRICGGNININAGEDAVKTSNDEDEDKGFVYIIGGELNISAGDDGIHAEKKLTIKDGSVDIKESYEGIEGTDVEISGGKISIVSTDDGVNAAGGSDGQDIGRPMEFGNLGNADYKLVISGGYLFVNAGGDGLDSNGTISVEGGFVLVSGPENNGNGALDYEVSAEISGGTLIAVGSAGMAVGFGNSSTQNSFMTNLTSAQKANTSVAVTDENNNVILSFTAPKKFENIVVSSSKLELNKEYNIIVGASVSDADENGFADSGSLSGGSVDSTITLDSVATNNGGGMGGMRGPGGPGGQGGPGGPGRM